VVGAVVATLTAAATLSLVTFANTAGATGPPSGSTLPGAAIPNGSFTAGTPFSDGQQIDVQVPANTVLAPNTNVNILECSAPGGVDPTDTLECQGDTIQGVTLKPRADGSIDLQAQTHSLYQLFALPDLLMLGETGGPECDLTTECVLYIGDSQGDFTQPHYWSQPFYIARNADDQGENPGDGSALTALTLTKSTTSTGFTTAGQTIPYKYLVTNTGNTTLTGISVSDNKNSVSCPSSTLAVGTDETCTGTYTVTAGDVSAGSVTNTATASAIGPKAVSSAPSTVTVTSTRSSGPASGSVLPGSASPSGSFTAGTPFSSGQQIDIKVPANTVLPVTQNVNILECSAPNGAVPTDPSACDGETIQGVSLKPRADGSIDLQVQTHSLYTLYALPDRISLEESPSGPKCDLTTECILFIGDNQGDFTQPHYWSQPFYVQPNADDQGENPGDGSSISRITLTKSTTSTGYGEAGQTVPYSYLVTNTGTTTLTGISVSDNKNPVGCPSSTLAPVTSEICTGTYTVTATDDTAGSVTNTATASATGPQSVSSAPSTVTVHACEAPVFTSGNPPTAVAGTAYSFSVTTCSVSVPAFKVTGLPKGLVLVSNSDGTATISGTPPLTDSGVSNGTITATVKGQAVAAQHFTLTVDNSPVFTSKSAFLAKTQVAFSYSVTTSSGFPTPTITTPSTLPGGVSLVDNHDGTAALTGTPTATAGGVYPITLTATNGIGSPVTQAFTLTVYQAPTLSSGATDTVDEGVSIAPFTVNYAGYPAPALKATGLPKGLTMVNNDNGTATISGTPTLKDAGNYTATIAAGSKAGTASETIAFTVDSSPVFKSKGATLVHTTVAFSYPVTTVYGFPTPTITTTSTLPDGVSLVDNGNGTAALTGTPTATAGGSYTITIVANTGVTAPATQTFILTVYQAPTITSATSDSVTAGVAMTPLAVDYAGYPAPVLKATGLPKGLVLVSNSDGTATISGIPAATDASPATVTVTASSKAGTASESITFTITA